MDLKPTLLNQTLKKELTIWKTFTYKNKDLINFGISPVNYLFQRFILELNKEKIHHLLKK